MDIICVSLAKFYLAARHAVPVLFGGVLDLHFHFV